ncbi:MAG: CotH kinase family protein, partial [Akkermansiaceae bacterium]|nr:CotH kinase family protein [Akkermansiaceae bacterium]
MKSLSLLIGCAVGFLSQISRADSDSPYLSELVAVGNTSHPDENGDGSDWLEIHNPGSADVDLGGYALTDDPADLTKWVFPATPLPAGGYLVVFASDKDRAVAGSELHTNFKLASSGEFLALVDPDGSTVVSQFSPAFPPQVEAYSYGIGTGGAVGFFKNSTPGTANGTPLEAPLLAPVITPAGATFARSLVVGLTTEVPGGVIRYTTNGAVPSAASTLYTGPITFVATTHLRAAVFDPATGARGALAGSHFLRLGSTASGGLGAPSTFTSDLPIMVVENFGAGSIPGPGATLQTARLAVHEVDPASGRSSLAANPDATMRMGIRRRGQSSADFPKAQYRVELRNELEEDFDYPLLGLPSDSDWVFNGPWTDKALIRNPLAFELGRTIGIAAPRTRHFEMFLSTNGGDLSAAEYVGVYILVESIKIGKDRTDIASLGPGDNTQPEVTGGYLMRFEPPGIAADGPRATGWNTVEILDPVPATRSQLSYIGRYLDDFAATLGWSHGAGSNDKGVINKDPLTGYPAFIDVDSFVHLLLINELLRDQDAYVRSDYMYKDRGGKLHKGPLWDYNLTTGTGCCFDNRNTAGWQYQDSYNRGGRDHAYEPDWFVPLLRDPDFLQHYIDRWGELRRDGVLELNRLFAVIDGLADPLTESALRNFKKWNTLGDGNVGFPTPVTATWEEQVEFIKIWLATRMAWIDSQFVASPRLIPASGPIAAGTHIAVGSGQSVYFTTDGSDPRLPGGGINLDAVRLSASGADLPVTFIARGSAWRYLDNGADLGSSGIVATQPDYGTGNWKHPAFDDSQWAAGDGIFGFTGTLTGATVATPLAPGPGSAPVITYYFRKTIHIPDALHVVSLRCEVLRDDGVIIYLNGREVARSNMNAG